jgi:hypothetical protein
MARCGSDRYILWKKCVELILTFVRAAAVDQELVYAAFKIIFAHY